MTLQRVVWRRCVECGAQYGSTHDPDSRLSWGYPYCGSCIRERNVRQIIAGVAA